MPTPPRDATRTLQVDGREISMEELATTIGWVVADMAVEVEAAVRQAINRAKGRVD